MKYYLILIIVLFFNSNIIFADIEDLELKFNVGWGEYLMDLPRSVNQEVLNQTKFSDKILSNFPGYYNYSVEVGFPVSEKLDLFFCYKHYSTGSLISYRDYSGEYRVETTVLGDCFGSNFYLHVLGRKTDFKAGVLVGVGICNNIYNTEELIGVYKQYQKSYFKIREISKYILPGIYISYNSIYGKFGITVSYFADVDLDNEIFTDWTGLRFSINYSVMPFRLLK